MSILNQNIREGVLALTTDGQTIKFASLTNIAQNEPAEWKMLKDMQPQQGNEPTETKKFIEFRTNNQEGSTADFTLTNCSKSHFDLIVSLYKNRKPFELTFAMSDGTYTSYENPRIKKKPMNETINESETSFNIMLNILCTEINPVV